MNKIDFLCERRKAPKNAHFGEKHPQKVRYGFGGTEHLRLGIKCKVMGVFGFGKIELIPPNQKNGFRGVRGGGGAHFGRFFAHFWRHFLTVDLTKKFIK